eukprot:TRINITY_DN30316_c0_g1_i2.p1 TRINITY_DN30316_c0_g1~~TRINITY_DN30316_c0_g1_i2.p1  ORF type:complete len:127 (-),score=33.26 TRINITY_DN30316_c0_g1_i2:17-397(-)
MADRDGSGSIDLDEFKRAVLSSQLASGYDKVHSLGRSMKDGKGLTRPEREVVELLGRQFKLSKGDKFRAEDAAGGLSAKCFYYLMSGSASVSIHGFCLLYTSDAADEEDSVDLGGRRIIKKKSKRR